MDNCCDNKPNYGTPNCLRNIAPIVGAYFSPKYINNQQGVLSRVALTDITIDDYFNSAAYFSEIGQFQFIGQLNNVELPIEDSKKEEAANGKISFLRQGKRTFNAELWDSFGSYVTKYKLSKQRCLNSTVFLVTSENQLIGIKTTEQGVDYFSGIPIMKQSHDPKFMFTTDTTTQKTIVNFDFDINFNEDSLWVIDCNNIANPNSQQIESFDMINPKFIWIDCIVKPISGTATTTIFSVNDDYRTGTRTILDNVGNVTGLGLNDFEISEANGNSINPSAIIELSDGVYQITHDLLVSGTPLKLRLSMYGNNNLISYSSEFIYFDSF